MNIPVSNVQLKEPSKKILRGVTKLARTVASTLGPMGRSVMYYSNGSPVITKDGVTVSEKLKWEDQTEDMASQVIMQAARRSADTTGDGTTTTTVLAAAIYEKCLTLLSTGSNLWEVREGLDKALEETIKALTAQAIEPTPEAVISVATISANGDRKVGTAIGEALNTVGPEGVIRVLPAKVPEISVEKSKGAWVDRGSLSPYFLGNTPSTRLENCYVLLSNDKVTSAKPLLSLLQELAPKARKEFGDNWSLLVIGSTVEGDALNFLVQNLEAGNLKCAAIRAPGYGDNHVEHLWDLAEIVEGKVLGDEQGLRYKKDLGIDCLGFVKEITVAKSHTEIMPEGQTARWTARVEKLSNEAKACTDPRELQKYQDRLARIGKNVATVYAGATTDVDTRELQFRMEDALGAARAALSGGVIPGGGTALLRAKRSLESFEKNIAGYNAFLSAIDRPFLSIYGEKENAYHIMAKMLEEDDTWVFDIRTQRSGNCVELGVLDPLDVTVEALKNATIAAKLLLSVSCTIEHQIPSSPTSSPDSAG